MSSTPNRAKTPRDRRQCYFESIDEKIKEYKRKIRNRSPLLS